MKLKQIGSINKTENASAIVLYRDYKSALMNLDGFSHIQVLWWAHLADTSEHRNKTILGKLFKNGPDAIGVFATRSPVRPNPIMVSTIEILDIDYKNGIIYTPFIDAEAGSPVLNVKPYQLLERIKNCQVPA